MGARLSALHAFRVIVMMAVRAARTGVFVSGRLQRLLVRRAHVDAVRVQRRPVAAGR